MRIWNCVVAAFLAGSGTSVWAMEGTCQCSVSVIAGATGLTLSSGAVRGPCGRPISMANVLSAPAPLAGAPIAQSGVLAAVAAALAIADSTVENNFFNPNPLTINVGDTVRWTWAGGSLHSVTSVAGSVESFDSGDLPTGTFSHAFTHAGTFTYYCDIHGFDFGNGTAGGMFAKIKVNAGIERPAYSGFSGAGTATPSRHRINNPRAGRTWRRRVNLGQ